MLRSPEEHHKGRDGAVHVPLILGGTGEDIAALDRCEDEVSQRLGVGRGCGACAAFKSAY